MNYVMFFALLACCIVLQIVFMSLTYWLGYRAGFNYAKMELMAIDTDETAEEACRVVQFRQAGRFDSTEQDCLQEEA